MNAIVQSILDFTKMLDDHKTDIAFVALGIEHFLVGLYMAVWHAGGYRTIWANFQGPKQTEQKQ